jgi:hypothetical protein
MDPLDLARQLVAHPRFRWAEGMAATTSDGTRWRLWRGDHDMLRGQGEPSGYIAGWELSAPVFGAALDLLDPATAGVLQVDLLRADPTAALRCDARETDAPFAVTVTDPTGTRRGFGGNVLGVVVAQGLLAVWGAP